MYVSLGLFFYMKSTFLGSSIFGSIDHIIFYSPMILLVPYLTYVLSLYNLCIITCFKSTPHTNYGIRCEVSQGGAPQGAPKLSQCAPSLSKGAPKVSQGAPTFFRHCNI